MNYTSILRLATTFVAFSISAHAAEVFSVTTVGTTYPVTTATLFNATAEDGVTLTNPYNIYATTDTGAGSGVTITDNFNGDSSAINTGAQLVLTNGQTGAITTATTYFGPKFYAGVNRSVYQTQGGVLHSNGNGYRVRSNNVSSALIGTAQVGTAAVAQVGVEGDADYAPAVPASEDYQAATGNGGEPINTKVIFMFDADTSSLSGADDSLIFGDTDTLTAKLSVPGTMGPNWTGSSPSRASLATYRAMVKADGKYYAGTLYSVDLANTPSASTQYNMSETGADATWTLMPNIEDDSTAGQVFGDTNLTVDTSESATTISGKFLTNITQVGFLLETDTNENTGGYNFGVREFIANASPASAPHPMEWSQDFTTPINETGTFLTWYLSKVYDPAPVFDVDGNLTNDAEGVPLNVLTGFDHAYAWASNGDGLTATPDASTITQSNNQIVLDVKSTGPDGEVNIRMVGPGTDNARRVRPPSHEVTFEIDLIEWKQGQADLLLQTRGHDGYVRSVISPSGNVKYSTWMSDFEGSGNISRNNVVMTSMRDTDGDYDYSTTPATGTLELPGTLLNDGQVLTYIQSYDNSDDSISFYYSLDGSDPQFITKLTAAEHSPDGTGFYSISTGNKWGQPNNQDAVWIQYKKWGSATTDGVLNTAKLGINSITVATSDDDRDGVINRNDAVPNDPFESVDSDSDGVGDNSDAHPGYNDSVISAGITQEVWDASQTALTTAQTAQATAETALTTAQADLTTAQADLTTAQADLTTAQDALANSLSLSDIQDLRAGSTMIAVSDGSATVSLQMEESSDLSLWSNLGDAVDFTVNLGAGDDTQFFRVKLAD
jgi:hypothetical protein